MADSTVSNGEDTASLAETPTAAAHDGTTSHELHNGLADTQLTNPSSSDVDDALAGPIAQLIEPDPNTAENATFVSTLSSVEHAASSSSSSSTVTSQSTETTLRDIASIMKDGFAHLREDLKVFLEKLETLEQTYSRDHLQPGNNRRRNRRGGNKGKGKAITIVDGWPSGPSGEKASNNGDVTKQDEDGKSSISNEGDCSANPLKQSRFAEIPPETLSKVVMFAVGACRAAYSSEEGDSAWQSASEASWNGEVKPKKEKTVLLKDESEVQRWLLSLRRVCKAWDPVIRNLVLQNLIIHNERMIDTMTAILTEKPELVKLMNEKAVINTMSAPTKTSKERHKRSWDTEDIAAEESDDDADGHDHVHQCPNCSDEAAAAAAARAGEDYVSPEVKASRFLEKASALQHVELQLDGRPSPHLRLPYTTFMERRLLNVLAASQLRTLRLSNLIMFTDLEKIMLGLRSLQNLHLAGGIENADRLDEVNTRDHQAALKSVRIDNVYGNCLGSMQFNWLLRPAAGSLEELDVELAAYLIPANQQGLADESDDDDDDDIPGACHPFATAAFADLLIRFGPTLKRLKLSSLENGPVLLSPDLQPAPHSGNLDFALSHCTALQVFEMRWTLTGAGMLDSLARCAKLRELKMYGPSPHTTASDLVNRLQQVSFPAMRAVRLCSFRRPTGVAGWSTRHTRELVDLCEDMKITLDITA